MAISLVVFDVQISFDPYSLTSIDGLIFIAIVFPQRSIQIRSISSCAPVGVSSSISSGSCMGSANSASTAVTGDDDGGGAVSEYFFHAVSQTIFQLFDDLQGKGE
jgi:hypothetical protein